MDGRDQIPSPLELFVEHCSTLLVVDETYPSQIKKIQTKNPQHNNKSPIKKKKKRWKIQGQTLLDIWRCSPLYKSVWFTKIIMHQTKIPFQAIKFPNRRPFMPFKTRISRKFINVGIHLNDLKKMYTWNEKWLLKKIQYIFWCNERTSTIMKLTGYVLDVNTCTNNFLQHYSLYKLILFSGLKTC